MNKKIINFSLQKKIETPQEIELYLLLPALKKQLALFLLNDFNLKQNEVAKIFNVTPSAINQYIKNKRGSNIDFSNEILKLIKSYAKRIFENKENSSVCLIKLLKEKKIHALVCQIHVEIDPRFDGCHICP